MIYLALRELVTRQHGGKCCTFPGQACEKAELHPWRVRSYLKRQRKNINIIKSKFTSTLTNKNKTRVWDEITNKVNALGICKRSVIEVKDEWRAMGSSAKKEHNKCASSRKKTGGGRQPESPKGTKIIELFEEDPSFSGILGGIDLGKP